MTMITEDKARHIALCMLMTGIMIERHGLNGLGETTGLAAAEEFNNNSELQSKANALFSYMLTQESPSHD